MHGVYEGMRAATNFRHSPPDLGFRYGMNEIGDGRPAVECGYTEAFGNRHSLQHSVAASRKQIFQKRDIAALVSMRK